jgi:hypothetical protein
MLKRDWADKNFQGVVEGTGVYLKWMEYMEQEIGTQGYASVLSNANLLNVANAAIIEQRESTIYDQLSTQASISGDEFKLIDTIQKNREWRTEKQTIMPTPS